MSTRLPVTATLTGLIDLSAPRPADITLRDISLKLATKNRWGCVLDPPLSVAQHSVLVANQLPPHWHIYGLLHDAHEAFLGDISTPFENLMERLSPGFRHHLANVKTRLDGVIRVALGVPSPDMPALAAVHEADQRMAATEWLSLMPAACGRWEGAQPIRSMRIKPLAWPAAEEQFRQALERELAMKSWEVAA